MQSTKVEKVEKVEKCPVCGGVATELFLACKDHTVSKSSFEIVECKNCGFAYTSPRPIESELGKFYESEEYISHSNTSKGIVSNLYQRVRKHTLAKKLELINSVEKKGALLDIGCGTGEFLNTMKSGGWETIGIEPSPSARKQGVENYNLDVREEKELENFPPNSFNVITMWHVLEHVPHLLERVQKLKDLLKYDGVLIIAVPNRNSHDAKHYGEYWAAYDVPRHLYHFRAQDMRTLMGVVGFEVEKILPMKFDSYYVSMLSEKCKTGSNNLISAVWTGWISNLKAGAEGSSSLIYIIRNKV
ncbi:MAG: class I SAM-dependent methyltransferase [Bacteroidetes bacterium]|nr:class I SAM-dependent methyltransferase [Bacteroidota bacterium]